jgi:uncharacterized cofD-like protein
MSQLEKKHIVVVGGGTGTHTVLTGLKHYQGLANLTAVVAVTDSGGSTGRLRDEFGYLPVGDVRMALAALAKEDDDHELLVRKLFLHRFSTNGDVAGHNFGNLFLVALTDILGSEEAAIEAASKVLKVSGRVLPVTHTKVHLVADYADGRRIVGEHHIDEPDGSVAVEPIVSLSLEPRATINPNVEKAILEADLIVFGPGDLYTSVLANCVVDGFTDVLKRSSAKRVYVANLMTKMGQTTQMGVKEHVEELARYTGMLPHTVLVNNTPLPIDLLERYASESEYPVCTTCDGLEVEVVAHDLLADEEIVRSPGDVLKRSLIRHDSHKLARALMKLLD